MTVFQDGRVKIELNFNAETSNVLIVNARALGEQHLDLTVMFDMRDVSMMPSFVSFLIPIACFSLGVVEPLPSGNIVKGFIETFSAYVIRDITLISNQK